MPFDVSIGGIVFKAEQLLNILAKFTPFDVSIDGIVVRAEQALNILLKFVPFDVSLYFNFSTRVLRLL